MENKSHALLAGLFTIALLVAAISIGAWLKRDQEGWVPFQIATKLSIPGLNPQAAVRYRGLDVGKVEEIYFDPQVAGQILISINVRPDTPITRSTYATLGYQGVTGIAYVQLDDDGSRPAKVESNERNMARIEMRPSVFEQLQNRGLVILEQTETITRQINDLLAPANQQAILDAFDNISKASNELGDIPRQLQPTLAKLPALTTQAQQTLGSLNTLSKDISALTNALRAEDGPLQQVGNAATQVGSAADKLEHETLPLMNDARSSLRALNRTLDGISERPQSVLFGSPDVAPGPGEAGFSAPTN
jgi:phospholipid/cholesterol/gamma-HCH transport system substrate-binding protein